jgi:hypothetical protein
MGRIPLIVSERAGPFLLLIRRRPIFAAALRLGGLPRRQWFARTLRHDRDVHSDV